MHQLPHARVSFPGESHRGVRGDVERCSYYPFSGKTLARLAADFIELAGGTVIATALGCSKKSHEATTPVPSAASALPQVPTNAALVRVASVKTAVEGMVLQLLDVLQ